MTPQQQTIAFAPAPLDPLPKPSLRRGDNGWQRMHDRILDVYATRIGRPLPATFTPQKMRDNLREGERPTISKRMAELAQGPSPWLVVVGKDGAAYVYALAPGMAERLKEAG